MKKDDRTKKPRARRSPACGRKRDVAPIPVVDRRALEKTMADLTRALRSREFSSVEETNDFPRGATGGDPTAREADTPIERAQELMYEAWDASGKRRVALARRALKISPDCADAYVLLAEEAATSPEDAKRLYEHGVAAGERALGPEFFEENAGHFWDLLETRPYMRALEGLAGVLRALDERDRAADQYEEILRLNPDDDQGVRYLLAGLLLAANENERLGRLLDRYPDDVTAEWRYTRALRLFRAGGETDAATRALDDALAANAGVVLFLFGLEELPDTPPQFYSPGDENEAALYAGFCGVYWHETPGAAEWFAGHLERTLAAFESPKAGKGRARHSRARAKRTTAAASEIYQLKVTLRGARPPIWRRLLVPASTKLSKLHDVLQIAMGWTDSHLHMFRVGGVDYGVPSEDDWNELIDERTATLADVLPRAKSKLIYEYDFGDGWEHEVLVEKALDAEPGATYPVCVAGRRACPPEDCGGVWGYADFLDAVKNPAHPEHDEMLEWIGGDFDPDRFDPDRVTQALARKRR